MFDIGWSELVVIAVVALIAIGPKELPGVLRMVGFQEAMREAEMADLKKSFDEVKEAATGFTGANVMTELQKDVTDALAIDKPATDAQVAGAVGEPVATSQGDALTTPTEPAAPTPQTFVEAETHVEPPQQLGMKDYEPAPQEQATPVGAPKEAKAS
ncbi:MAG: twin-arginine translocase subunit TatB [Bradyrhizobium icense]|nr:MAG: twin-arginine translocase subunit TatB [Bradyrhizobium icense]